MYPQLPAAEWRTSPHPGPSGHPRGHPLCGGPKLWKPGGGGGGPLNIYVFPARSAQIPVNHAARFDLRQGALRLLKTVLVLKRKAMPGNLEMGGGGVARNDGEGVHFLS